ncbi:transglycosylase domain-containing protein [Rubrobacter indicoceani]|uniref:transglycosylase domain-containing protein n=1 Tax=Rubrobacter indicoceani TaxID=2051957 RepID=UPI000E5B4D0E|nr:transglycosylase domain-containing protein [Rubrobacter indicoceani]
MSKPTKATDAFRTARQPAKRPEKKRSPVGPPRRKLRFVRGIFNLAVILVLLAAAFVGGSYLYFVESNEQGLSETNPPLPENSYIYDRNGAEIAYVRARENRETVGADRLGRYLPEAVIAIEDRRFGEHVGVDFEGLGRAAWNDLRAGRVEEGGSTITEQLMKNVFFPEEERYEASFARRFAQANLAFSYERRHTKGEILTNYLNTVYFGEGAYGAEVAARSYFGKSASELTLGESAALAGFLHAPSTYGGGDAQGTERATERRDEVLGLMEEQGMISSAERARAQGEPLVFSPAPTPDLSGYETFVDGVRREVEAQIGRDAFGSGGLRIQTTLDATMQRAAEEAASEVLYAPDDPSAAVVSIEPQSGAVRAVVGQDGSFNLALDARRQPGSAFKPFVLAEAAERNISPESLFLSQSVEFGQGEYVINNNYLVERGPLSLLSALAESDNTVFVRLGMYLSLESVVDTARALGIESRLDANAGTVIGGSSAAVSPFEMASSYATFAANGVYREPYSVKSIERVGFGNSETVYGREVAGERVLGSNQAAAVTAAMRGVVENGTASRFHDLDRELGKPSAGKTGTTDDYVDAWYVGYTPRLATAVWVGYPDGSRSMAGVHGIEEAGGETLPLDLWALYMARATEEDPVIEFSEPDFDLMRYLDESGYEAGENRDVGRGAAVTPQREGRQRTGSAS